MQLLKIGALVAGIAFLLVGSLWFVTGSHPVVSIAEALQSSQTSCDMTGDELSFTKSDGYVSAGDPVTINNGGATRTVVFHFTANKLVSLGGEIRIAYSLDGSEPQENVFGPANFGNYTEFGELNTTFAVFPDLAPGEHTIEPFVSLGHEVQPAIGTLWQRCYYAVR